MDSALGRLRDELTALGVRGNTMFWMTSDNGPETGANSPNETNTTRSISSGRFLERKRSLHEGGVRVPGILEWPDVITSGRSTGYPAVTSDYYPTILDFLELAVPGQKPLDGISLRPLINGTATTRTNPIGFKIESKKSWVNHQYKLLDKGGGWLLYDLIHIPPGEEVEQTPIATAANINSKSQAIRDVYNTMLAEYTAWNNAVGSDIPYIHPSRPTVTLQTPQATVDGPFQVTATFSENISQLHAGEFAVVNGSASDLNGSGSIWTVTITPSSTGQVKVSLPEAAAIDADGNPNAPSNTLSTSSNDLPTGAIISNGDLGITVTQYGSSDGNTGYYLDTTTLDVFEQTSTGSPVNTARNAGEWLWSRLSRGFAYNASGGAAGDGAFVAYTGADSFNQRPRAVVQFAHNGSTTTGPQTLAMDVFLDDNSASHALTFLVQLYAWNAGQTGPRLSLGGATENVATYNVTTLGGAQTLLNTRIAATSVADAAWQTVTLGQLDLGNGYDFYAWRIGVMGQSPGDGFAFDNVRVVGEDTTFMQWIDGFGLDVADQGFNHDPDNDGLANGLEAWFGTHPGEFDSGLSILSSNGSTATFSHPRNANPPSDLVGFYEWSRDLVNWYAGDGLDGPPGGPFVTFELETAGTNRTVNATSSAPIGRYFLRAKAELTSSP
jgi:hypothetical protein